MNSEEQTTPIVEAWLKGTSDTPYGTEMGVGRVKSRVRQTRQRGRRWPMLSFQRTPAHAPGLPATNGHSPTAIGRTMPMFSATKFVVAGVIVALFGGFMLIAQPFEQQGESVPGAATGGPGTFSPAGTLAEARGSHTATLLPDGRVLVVGGWVGGSGGGGSAEVWDPVTASFGPAGSLAEARSGHTATLLPDGRVLVVGGFGDDDVLASAEVWDPETGSFGPGGSLAEARARAAAALLPDGRVLVVGGDGNVNSNVASAEVWDPATGMFASAGSLEFARFFLTATALPDGRVLVVGGRGDGDVKKRQTLAEVWDPVTASFGPAGSLAEARWVHTATLLPDGRVLVVGGMFHNVLTSPEVWDPVTASFGPAGSLAEGRAGHTATLLSDGRVLVVGGEDGGPLASAEVWEASDG